MRINPFYDAWMFLTGQTGEHAASGIGWLLTALFIALLVATIWLAIKNWRDDPAQRTAEHLATWFMRVMIGAMWFQGSLWKLPLPISGAFKFWTGQLGKYGITSPWATDGAALDFGYDHRNGKRLQAGRDGSRETRQ